MIKISQKNLSYKEKYGVPVYDTNPSIPNSNEIKKLKMAKLGNDQKGFIVNNGSGEILGSGVAVVYEWEEVDQERFVKLYLVGLKQAEDLSKAGFLMFVMVNKQLQENPGKDTVLLSVDKSNLTQATYFRGLRELLDKEFLFRSPYDGTFFVNIRFMFNGDRLAFIKGYRLKSSNQQQELPLLEALEEKKE